MYINEQTGFFFKIPISHEQAGGLYNTETYDYHVVHLFV